MKDDSLNKRRMKLMQRDPDSFFRSCHNAGCNISGFMKKTVRNLLGNEQGIRNAMAYSYSNGVIEGTNNLIKVTKYIAFGYRSFVSFKIRILSITNTMVRFRNKKARHIPCTSPYLIFLIWILYQHQTCKNPYCVLSFTGSAHISSDICPCRLPYMNTR